jgi:hypothetical protein
VDSSGRAALLQRPAPHHRRPPQWQWAKHFGDNAARRVEPRPFDKAEADGSSVPAGEAVKPPRAVKNPLPLDQFEITFGRFTHHHATEGA